MDLILLIIGLVLAFLALKFVEHWLRKPYITNITKDKYVFITGCDTGFGNLLAKQLDAKGVHVIATCLTKKSQSDLEEATSSRVTTFLLDVCNSDSVAAAYRKVREILPHESALWGVVNNAGISNVTGYLEWSKRQDYEKILAVNLFGAIDVTLTFLPLLKKSSGRLVNVASSAGRIAAIPGGYCESKFALEAFSDVVRRERRHLGYRFQVSIIEPGFFATPLASAGNMERPVTSAWNRLSHEQKKEFPEALLRKFVDEKVSLISSMSSTDLWKVTNAIEHALFARWPRTRYTVGWDARLVWIPLSYLPAWLSDIICP